MSCRILKDTWEQLKKLVPFKKNKKQKSKILSPPPQDCGADCAKFQKSELEFKFNKKALARPYTSKHSWGETYGVHKRHLEFSHDQYRELQKYAEEVGIYFTASGMDEVRESFVHSIMVLYSVEKFNHKLFCLQMAVEFLHELNVPFFKVGSGDTNNFPYLVKTAKKGESEIPCVEKWLKFETQSSASVFYIYIYIYI